MWFGLRGRATVPLGSSCLYVSIGYPLPHRPTKRQSRNWHQRPKHTDSQQWMYRLSNSRRGVRKELQPTTTGWPLVGGFNPMQKIPGLKGGLATTCCLGQGQCQCAVTGHPAVFDTWSHRMSSVYIVPLVSPCPLLCEYAETHKCHFDEASDCELTQTDKNVEDSDRHAYSIQCEVPAYFMFTVHELNLI